MAIPNSNITKSIAVASDGFRRTDDPDGSGLAPTTPPSFTTSKTSSTITATITQSNGATDYEVRVDATSYEHSTDGGTTWSTITSPIYRTGLTAGTQYTGLIRPVNATGSGTTREYVITTLANVAAAGNWPDIKDSIKITKYT